VHDVVVLGGGPGGYATAFRAAARGLDVALVEADLVGGTCLHRGCIPSKAILYVAEVLEEVNRGEVFGLKLSYDGLDGDGLDAFRSEVITRLHKGLQFLATKRSTLHTGRGRLARDAEGTLGVEVIGDDGEVSFVAGRHVVLATGSVAKGLPGVTIDGEVVQTSDQALWFTTPPRRAVIVGAGAIGMEFASMWRPFGTEVTVVEALDRVLPLEDAECSKAVADAYRRRGIEVLTSASVTGIRVEPAGDAAGAQGAGAEADADADERDGHAGSDGHRVGSDRYRVGIVDVEVAGQARSLTADVVLVATGRGPNTADAGAAELGVLDERGYVVADAYGATEVPGLWAVGDVLPTLALAHAAFVEGFVVADRIAGVDHVAPVDHVHTPRVTYCHPEVASVGLTEAQARERYGDDGIAVTTSSLRANAKGILAGSSGFVKVVHATGDAPHGATGDTGPVIGVHVVGPHATDLIGEAALATTWEALPAELAAIVHAHPTLYEAMGEAFLSAAGLPMHGH
jgi:dihydrolipoamide dehydrogenase